MRHILGISAYYHDSAAALVRDGEILAAAQEERFSRKKNDERFPRHAVDFCLAQAGIRVDQLDAVVFYDKPITKFDRLLEAYLAVAPRGLTTFPKVLPTWLGEKLNLRRTLIEELGPGAESCRVCFTEHHKAHAASAFYPSPFNESAILTVDGVGEWATTTLGVGRGHAIEILSEIRFPHSLGLLYSTFTAYCGFRINSGEYKLMGLAPYGEPRYTQAIYDHLIDVKPDGSFWLDLDCFGFLDGFTMDNDRFRQIFGGPPRSPEAPMEERFLHIARSIQAVTEDVILRLARHARKTTGMSRLCMAGGVALNCVANGKLHREGVFDQLWIQPAAGDAGGALGAALQLWHSTDEARSRPRPARDSMQASLLGPEFSDEAIREVLERHGAVFERLDDTTLLRRTAELLTQEKVIGWVQGRMEFGPRALGNRSIIGDARSSRMQSVMNLKVKFRESFRPFAPIVRRERVSDYFDLDADSPYMLLVAPVKESLRRATDPTTTGLDRLKQIRSEIPAVTHVDHSARIQTLTREQNPKFYALLEQFEAVTGCGLLVNTSFNVRGEPIVCTPDDAYRCFINTEMDYLAIGNYLLDRLAQPHRSIARTFEPQPD
ncbi:MAG: carbamoyltransferase [Verrucomicrobia bacterium]|nr:carbamoyltransferase [Verrucomicrobiota bacterium]MBI3870538.1 carbamoyltransferase [Verrucomicrobiota bacterium]